MLKSTYYFLKDIIFKRKILHELIRRDLQKQYAGSYLGMIWLFLQPLCFISILYAVFTLGFRSGNSEDMPFSIYLISGMVAWLYFSSNFSSNTQIIREYSFLVKKVDFRLSLLPIVQLVSSFVVHAVLVCIAILLAWYEGYSPSLYTFQLIYYFLCMFVFLLGLGWLTSSANVFIKDVSKLVSILVQFGFWLTPIFWNIKMLPEQYRWIIELNPMYYIISGYRDSIVTHIGFWEKTNTLYYWLITIACLYFGIKVYKKLKPHFAEVV